MLEGRRVGIAHGRLRRHARAGETGDAGRGRTGRGGASGSHEDHWCVVAVRREKAGSARSPGDQQRGNGWDRGPMARQGADALRKPCRPSAEKCESRKLSKHVESTAVPALRAGGRSATQRRCRRQSAFCRDSQEVMHAGFRILLGLNWQEAFSGRRQKSVEIFRHAS